ncbi:MAG: metallophosphoesterase, partial [Clostridia bacterium]|nr:metallophosphoesterase [Clostridia bacterium]
MKKFLSVTLAVIMIAATLPFSFAAEKDTVILYTNDVHCAIEDYAVLAAYRAELIAQGHNVITVDAGDAIQGEVIGSTTEGEAVVDIMNAVGYDYAVPGNHEFDYGMEVFLDLAQNKAEYDYISSNFYNLTSNSPMLKPYAIEDFGAYQIAFVGISTPDTVTSTTPEYFKDENGNFIYGFPAYPGELTNEDLYNNIQESVDKAINDGADYVVAVGHAGIIGSNDGWKSSDIIANTDGIDCFIDAHSHETTEKAVYKNKNNEDVFLTSTGAKFANFGALTISGDNESFELINPDNIDIDTMSSDAKSAYTAVKAKVDGYNEE